MRPPVVAGVGGGVGTTTVAVALRGRDAERDEAGADILVCRGTLDSLRRAAALLDRAAPGPRPVLAVHLDGARAPRGPVRARLELLEPAAGAVVLLPHVRSWHTVADPLPEVARLLVDPPERVPRPARAYVAALRELAAAVVASGRLHPAPATPARIPLPGGPSDASRQGGRPGGAVGSRITACPDGRLAVPRGAGGGGAPGGRPWGPAAPRVVNAFRPVMGGAAPGATTGPAAPVPRRAGVRIVVPPARPAPVRPLPAAPVGGPRPTADVPAMGIERAG